MCPGPRCHQVEVTTRTTRVSPHPIPSLTLAAAADTVSMTETSLPLPFSHGAPGPAAPAFPGGTPNVSAVS